MATSRDVAKLAGVSVATVSRTYAKRNTVSPQTAERVLEAAKQLGYTPNIIARSLKSNKTKTIGLVVPNVYNPFFFQVAAVMTSELEKYDYKILISFNNKYDQSELSNIKSLISAQVDALLFTPFLYNPEIPKFLKNSNIYTLQILGNLYYDFDSILCDDYSATCNITQYLIDRGHTNIMMITPALERKAGMFTTLRKNRLPVHAGSCISTLGVLDSESLIEKALVAFKPSAVIVVAQEAKISLLKVIRKLKYTIPDDLSIVGYDDDALSDFMNITTVGHNIDYIGKEISRALLERLMAEPDEISAVPKRTLLDTTFIERTSVKKY